MKIKLQMSAASSDADAQTRLTTLITGKAGFPVEAYEQIPDSHIFFFRRPGTQSDLYFDDDVSFDSAVIGD